jgi:hypothetical protein
VRSIDKCLDYLEKAINQADDWIIVIGLDDSDNMTFTTDGVSEHMTLAEEYAKYSAQETIVVTNEVDE